MARFELHPGHHHTARAIKLTLLVVFTLLPSLASADARTDLLKQVGIDQNIGAQIPPDITFRDEAGRDVRLGDYFGKRPMILSLVYHSCPMLCSTVLNELGVSLNVMTPSAGEQFDVLTISFDPHDTPAVANQKKAELLRHYRRPRAQEGWHFLTGDAASIERLTKAVGFRYLADPQFAGQFIHAGGVIILTPSGKVSRYFYGINYAAKDLRLALAEAGEEHSGSLSDAILLFCFHYDPHSGHYTMAVLRFVKVGAVLTLAVLGVFWLRHARTPPLFLSPSPGTPEEGRGEGSSRGPGHHIPTSTAKPSPEPSRGVPGEGERKR